LIIIWFLLNVGFLWFLADTHMDYLEKGYVVKGRGQNAKVIKKQDDPAYYNWRMRMMWSGYFAIPLITGAVLYFNLRKMPNHPLERDGKHGGVSR